MYISQLLAYISQLLAYILSAVCFPSGLPSLFASLGCATLKKLGKCEFVISSLQVNTGFIPIQHLMRVNLKVEYPIYMTTTPRVQTTPGMTTTPRMTTTPGMPLSQETYNEQLSR